MASTEDESRKLWRNEDIEAFCAEHGIKAPDPSGLSWDYFAELHTMLGTLVREVNALRQSKP